MRFLADMGISMSTVEALRRERHEVVHLREEGLQRLPDPAILAKAREEARTVLTFDLDFGDLLAIGGQSYPSVIIFRLRDETPAVVTAALRGVLADQSQTLAEGAIIIVEDARYRIRRLPIEGTGAEL
jgi:predicted nuclease of predicted toxin-antitoxin system